MRKLLLACLLLTAASVTAAQSATPIIGNWKLNLEKSQFPNPRHPQLEVRQYRERDDGFLVGLAISVDYYGNPGFLQFTARSDGNFYTEYNSATLSDLMAAKTTSPLAYAEKFTSDRTIDWTDQRNGTVTGSGTKQISDDGKQLFIMVNYVNAKAQPATYTLVYDKQ